MLLGNSETSDRCMATIACSGEQAHLDDGGALQLLGNKLLHVTGGARIHAGSALVQAHNARPCQQHARQAQQLLLPCTHHKGIASCISGRSRDALALHSTTIAMQYSLQQQQTAYDKLFTPSE